MSHRDEYRHWPFLNSEEFELACAFLDQRYVRANLGASRRSFKLRLRRTITTGSSHIEILRILRLPEEDQELTSQLEKLWNGTTGAVSATDMEVDMANEETDHEALRPATASHQPPSYSEYSHQPYVIYEIHLHPTYNVPTLWFTLHDLPMGEPAFNLDSVYRYLVPDEFKDRLRAAGIAGGLSAAPHPVSDVPAFFIHPCQTKEAMENFDCSLQNYLMVWIGLVGSCIGLWVPREMAEE